MQVQILDLAIEDLARGKSFYDSQEQNLGDYFLDTLLSDIDSLVLYAGIHRKVRGYHCLFSQRFPYAVYYKTKDEFIEVYRVLDCRQDPKKTENALQ